MTFPTARHTNLFSAIRSVKSNNEMRDFLRDLMTIGELDALAERWHIARLLWETDLSYKQIAAKTHASTTTVTRVAQWLNRGMGGYRTILARLSGKRS